MHQPTFQHRNGILYMVDDISGELNCDVRGRNAKVNFRWNLPNETGKGFMTGEIHSHRARQERLQTKQGNDVQQRPLTILEFLL